MKPRLLNLTGLPIEAAMEIAARDFLRSGMAALLHITRELSRNGIDCDAINALLERKCFELEIWRVKSLAELHD